MEQEIVIRAPLHDDRSSSTAMTRASKMKGVTKVEVVRERNHLVVTGVGVDAVELTKSLRKKFCFAHVVSVRNITVRQRDTSTEDYFQHPTFYNDPTQSYNQPSYNYIAVPVHDPDPSRFCFIL